MKIVINSHIKSEIALNHLLESMRIPEEFKLYDIIVVIGGYYDSYSTYHIQTDDNITYIKCNHNSIDFTGLIALLELYNKNEDEYYFYIHDTCVIGNNFYKKIKTIDLNNISSISINLYSMNMGVYSQKIINHFKDFLLSMKNNDEKKVLEFKEKGVYCESYILNNNPNNILKYNDFIYDGIPIDYYNTGILRTVEYNPHLDLYKIKSYYQKLDFKNLNLNN